MGKSLVIVESPAKAKTINKYLGKDYIVKSSVGHIRDLPVSGGEKKSGDAKERARQAAITRKMSPEKKLRHRQQKAREQLIRRMGVNPEKDWEARYEILPGKEKVVAELVRIAKDAEAIYLATDMDREGEAIAWHLQEAIGGDPSRYRRVVFNEITESAIRQAFANPGPVDMNRVQAQQARRFLDRVVGYMVSPLLWAKIARGLSAGRVQSVALRLVVEREREIRAFIPEEYWDLFAKMKTAAQDMVKFEVKKYRDKAFKPVTRQHIDTAMEALQSADYRVAEVKEKPTSTKPSAPYITSTLQQAASTRLGFGVKKTMTMAQRLYEAGYITYMRTDSTNLSKDAVADCRAFIGKKYGKKYLPDNAVLYSSSEGAQDAHEAIRPSDVLVEPNQVTNVDRDAERLYNLIWRQFVACQMPAASFLGTTVTLQAGDYELSTRGRVILFDGYQRVQPPMSKKEEDAVLPAMQVGEKLKLEELIPTQHFTKPPARYTEASLVKEMEKRGIGRPSTYAAIISTIQDRGYVQLEKRRFYAQKMGDIVTERLVESFTDLMDYDFTANMEGALDDVAKGKREWHHLLDEFYEDFSATLLQAQNDDDGGMRPNTPTETDIECPQCGRPMLIRTGATGVFLGCSGYALPPKERCKQTLNLMPGDEAVNVDEDDEAEAKLLIKKHHCANCNTAMDGYLLDEKRKLHICGNNPDCSGFEVESGNYKIKGYEGPVLECDKCGSEMQLKTGRFGKYFGCTSTECANTRKLLRSGEAAPPKMDPVPMPELKCQKVDDHYVLRDGASGLFLAASGFPRNRETRAPLVAEILPHEKEIDAKYRHLFSAPVADPDGQPTVIRYSRKAREIYVQSEEDGKATGWKAFYKSGTWVATDGKSVRKNKKTKKRKKVSKKTGHKSASQKMATRKIN